MRERLYRSRSDRILFGVAGGMAEWLDADPSLVRLIWALLILAGGVGLVLYVIAAIVVPENPLDVPTAAFAPNPGGPTAAASSDPATSGDRAAWEARRARIAARRERRGNGPGIVMGIVLVFAGTWFLLQRFFPAFDSSLVFPGVLIILGLALLVGALARSTDAGGHEGA